MCPHGIPPQTHFSNTDALTFPHPFTSVSNSLANPQAQGTVFVCHEAMHSALQTDATAKTW